MRYIFVAIVISFALISCQKEENPEKKSNPGLNGKWVNPIYIDTLVTYERSNNLIENQYGIAFGENNKCLERKNNGWCGTPPITTADYEGIWTWSADSVVNITVGYWGGEAEYVWKVLSIDEQKLVISIVKTKFQ